MKQKILEALQAKDSVIFRNRLTGKLSFYNGMTNQFELITEKVFNELYAEKLIKVQLCICQGEDRFILA